MAVVKKVRKKEGENLTSTSVDKVISLLERDNPITKKEAYEILNIAANPSRLANIIAERKAEIDTNKKRRAANRGKPAKDFEIQIIIESYLEGDTVSDIAQRLYRSSEFVKQIVEKVGVPAKRAGETYFDFEPLPDRCVSEVFDVGEIVWSSRYQGAAEILKDVGMCFDGLSRVYSVFVFTPSKEPDVKFFETWGKSGFYANQRAYDLGRLSHLSEYGVDIRRILKRNATT